MLFDWFFSGPSSFPFDLIIMIQISRLIHIELLVVGRILLTNLRQLYIIQFRQLKIRLLCSALQKSHRLSPQSIVYLLLTDIHPLVIDEAIHFILFTKDLLNVFPWFLLRNWLSQIEFFVYDQQSSLFLPIIDFLVWQQRKSVLLRDGDEVLLVKMHAKSISLSDKLINSGLAWFVNLAPITVIRVISLFPLSFAALLHHINVRISQRGFLGFSLFQQAIVEQIKTVYQLFFYYSSSF